MRYQNPEWQNQSALQVALAPKQVDQKYIHVVAPPPYLFKASQNIASIVSASSSRLTFLGWSKAAQIL